MSSQRLRVGMIGAGLFALHSHLPNFRRIDGVEIAAISRRNPERLAQAKEISGAARAYTDWREMLDAETLDAVVVTTPHDAHTEPTLAALERGVHVMLEKPMALTVADCRAMIDAAERAGRVLTLGYNARGLGGWRAVRRALQSGAVGRVRQLAAVVAMDSLWFRGEAPVPADMQQRIESDDPIAPFMADLVKQGNWRSKADQAGGGMFNDSGSHVVDMLLWLGGGPARDVVAFADGDGETAERRVNAQGRFVDDIAFSITSNDSVADGGQGRITVIGDDGVLTADWTGMMATEASEVWLHVGERREKVEPAADTQTPADGFVAAIRDGAPNYASPREGAQVVALTQAIYQSAREGRIVTVEQI